MESVFTMCLLLLLPVITHFLFFCFISFYFLESFF